MHCRVRHLQEDKRGERSLNCDWPTGPSDEMWARDNSFLQRVLLWSELVYSGTVIILSIIMQLASACELWACKRGTVKECPLSISIHRKQGNMSTAQSSLWCDGVADMWGKVLNTTQRIWWRMSHKSEFTTGHFDVLRSRRRANMGNLTAAFFCIRRT